MIGRIFHGGGIDSLLLNEPINTCASCNQPRQLVVVLLLTPSDLTKLGITYRCMGVNSGGNDLLSDTPM